ncbi:hypothetical protein ACN6MT_29390 (plasmid) [Neobacillus niacini]|jgi:hypothetical protein|uniref:hypothetical protein n=1 Tax=Neobacillus niacini TaxID=86668 RepID=UPI003B01734F
MALRIENYLHTLEVSVPDRLVVWAIENLTEDDIEGDHSSLCGCDSEYECPSALFYVMEGFGKWESWMDGISERNLIFFVYCYECEKWTIYWDMDENEIT